ncbi:MAG: FAD synthase [Parcubacteria group bacterium GW2011_GWB1_45_9]|nr:MAG: FAD synthase [Parcubacteria group bacterium GW2011_GWB1_45_9]
MVFGVFDGIHDGHRDFFKQARELGDELIAVVAHDHIAKHLKGRLPQRDLAERFEHLKQEDGVNNVVEGDRELSSWKVIEKYKPDIIALGYDQAILKKDLEGSLKKLNVHPEIKVLKSYEI